MKEYSTETGAALEPVAATAQAAHEILDFDLDLIIASRTNPRTTFDPAYLNELAATIKPAGRVLQAILLRPLPASRLEETAHMRPRPTHEIVFGECRYRASKIAGMKTIRSTVEDLQDAEVGVIQLIENLKRKDLTVLEEATGYRRLIEESGMSADAVADEIKKSRAYVYARLKLLDLSQECKDALRSGAIDPSRALLIARIPDTALQAKALAEATRKGGNGDVISVRDLQTWLQKNVMLRLEHATFKITDSRLVKEAGSCKDCPKRTGANPDLFSDVDGADICTDPACFHGKTAAHRAALIAQAEKKGLRLVDGKEAAEICNRFSSNLRGYLPLSQVREDADIATTGVRTPTLRDLLGKDAPGAVLIEHPYTHELVEAVPEAEAEALLLTRGLIKATSLQVDKKEEIAIEIEHLRDSVQQRTAMAAHEAKYQAVIDAIRATPDARAASLITSDLLRAWLGTILGDSVEEEEMADMLGYTFEDGQDEMDALNMHIRACSHGTLFRALAIYIAKEDNPYNYNANDSIILKTMYQPLAIDEAAIDAAAKATVKAEVAEKIKQLKAQAKPPKPLPPLAPAAHAMGGGGAQAQSQKPQSPAAPARKKKMSADEAQAAIAAAMQGQDTDQGAADASQSIDASQQPGSGCALPVGASPSAILGEIAATQYTKAVNLVVIQRRASISHLQRILGIGYNAAARMIERMEAEGIVGPMLPDGKRDVLRPSPIEQPAEDPLFDKALAIIIRDQKASVRQIKAGLKISTDRAAELLDKLAQAGKVSVCDERGARKVLVTA